MVATAASRTRVAIQSAGSRACPCSLSRGDAAEAISSMVGEMNVRTVSKLICELREARSMTRPQLARCSQIARAHLWAIETGRYVPGIVTLQRISDALGVGLGRFFKSDVEFLLEHRFVQCVRPLLPNLNDGHRATILKVLHAAPKKKFPRSPR